MVIFLLMTLLPVYSHILQWKNCEDWSAFGKTDFWCSFLCNPV